MESKWLFTKILLCLAIEIFGFKAFPQAVSIDMIKGCETTGTIRLSDIADKIDYVKLETTKDCLIGRTNQLYFFKDNWFVRYGATLCFSYR